MKQDIETRHAQAKDQKSLGRRRSWQLLYYCYFTRLRLSSNEHLMRHPAIQRGRALTPLTPNTREEALKMRARKSAPHPRATLRPAALAADRGCTMQSSIQSALSPPDSS